MKESHEEFKKEMGFKIYEIKDQIDTELKNPNIVWSAEPKKSELTTEKVYSNNF